MTDTRTRAEQILSAFKAFHAANPSIWSHFERFALQAVASGRDTYSANAIFERIRWFVEIESNTADECKLNNNFRAYYARMFHAAHPEHDGLFRNRRRTSESRAASANDQQFFDSGPVGDEAALMNELRLMLGGAP